MRARHYRPGIGSFVSRDPFEGMMARPMSRNGYSWVESRVVDRRDPSGLFVFNYRTSGGQGYSEGVGITAEFSQIAFTASGPDNFYKFVTIGVTCGATIGGARTAQIASPVSAGVGLNMRLGIGPEPMGIGQVTYGTSGGGSVPYWGTANLQGDISIDPATNTFSLGLGAGSPSLPSLSYATSASICVSNSNTSWTALPQEAYAGIEDAIYGLIGFCVQ